MPKDNVAPSERKVSISVRYRLIDLAAQSGCKDVSDFIDALLLKLNEQSNTILNKEKQREAMQKELDDLNAKLDRVNAEKGRG